MAVTVGRSGECETRRGEWEKRKREGRKRSAKAREYEKRESEGRCSVGDALRAVTGLILDRRGGAEALFLSPSTLPSSGRRLQGFALASFCSRSGPGASRPVPSVWA